MECLYIGVRPQASPVNNAPRGVGAHTWREKAWQAATAVVPTRPGSKILDLVRVREFEFYMDLDMGH